MKKLVCLALALLMLAGSLVACGETKKPSAETTGTSESSGTKGDSSIRSLSNVPDDLTFDGADFVVATRGTSSSIDQEEIVGEGTADSVYKRNRMAEDKLKVKISHATDDDTKLDFLVTSIKAGEQTYSGALTHITRMASLVQEGYFINVDEVPYLDLEQPYWAKSVTDSLTVGDKSYLFSGDMTITDNTNIWCVYFNKELTEDLGLESPYVPLEEGRWTMDMFSKNAALAASDVNGDGIWDYSTDRFGVSNLNETLCGYYNGMGQLSVIRNEEDELVFNLGAPSSVDALQRISKWATAGSETYLLDVARIPADGTEWDQLVNVFVSGRSLYHVHTAVMIFMMREMEQAFGILPMPKADEKQDKYVSSTQEWGQCVMAVPVCAPDLTMAGAVIEYLGGISTDTIRTAYYDVALTRKMSRDKESSVSLDIIFDNIVIDPGFSYFGLRSTVEDIATGGTIASKLQSKEKSINRQIQQIEKIINKLDH